MQDGFAVVADGACAVVHSIGDDDQLRDAWHSARLAT